MRRFAALAAAAFCALSLVACGGDAEPEATATAAAPTATPTPEDPLTAYVAMDLHDDLADGQTLGDPGAPVTLTIFEDFQCPFCLAFNLAFEQIIVEEYVAEGDVLLEFKHYTILGDESVAAARASVCAAEQGRFWHLHNRFFLVQAQAGQLEDEELNVGRFSDENLATFAEEAGADRAEFDACYAGDDSLAKVQADFTEARTLGIRGTPTLLIDGEVVQTPRDADELRELLDAALE
jgi:protein-disulfide isomerase